MTTEAEQPRPPLPLYEAAAVVVRRDDTGAARIVHNVRGAWEELPRCHLHGARALDFGRRSPGSADTAASVLALALALSPEVVESVWIRPGTVVDVVSHAAVMTCLDLHHAYHRLHVAEWPDDGCTVLLADVRRWIAENERRWLR